MGSRVFHRCFKVVHGVSRVFHGVSRVFHGVSRPAPMVRSSSSTCTGQLCLWQSITLQMIGPVRRLRSRCLAAKALPSPPVVVAALGSLSFSLRLRSRPHCCGVSWICATDLCSSCRNHHPEHNVQSRRRRPGRLSRAFRPGL